MGRKSTFSQLPEEVADYFHSLLGNGKYTQAQIAAYLNEMLAELGEPPVMTRDIVQKQAKNYQERLAVTGEKLRRERELADAMMKEVGYKPSTSQSQLLSSLLQSMTTRLGMEMDDGEALPSAKELKDLALAKRIIDDSNRINQQLIKQARDEEKAHAAEVVEKTAKALGISAEKRDIIRRDVLGMG